MCDYSCSQKGNMKRHVASIHENEKFAEKDFLTKTSLPDMLHQFMKARNKTSLKKHVAWNDNQVRRSRKTKIYIDGEILLPTKIKTRNTLFIESVITSISDFTWKDELSRVQCRVSKAKGLWKWS